VKMFGKNDFDIPPFLILVYNVMLNCVKNCNMKKVKNFYILHVFYMFVLYAIDN